jgi:hypothetical protein
MSLNFSQIVNKIDRACKTTSTNYSLANKAIDVNLALDEAMAIIFQQGGTWQYDDRNHSHDPIITTNLVSGQRDYHFTVDEDSSIILDILEVWAKNSATGDYVKLERIDMVRDGATTMHDGNNSTGVPTQYGLLGNGIFLDLIPSYNSTSGLKVYINREAHYFVSGDTTAVAGIDGSCHNFLYLKPSYEYARDNGLKDAEQLYRDLEVSKQKIINRYKTKERNIIKKITANVEDSR